MYFLAGSCKDPRGEEEGSCYRVVPAEEAYHGTHIQLWLCNVVMILRTMDLRQGVPQESNMSMGNIHKSKVLTGVSLSVITSVMQDISK